MSCTLLQSTFGQNYFMKYKLCILLFQGSLLMLLFLFQSSHNVKVYPNPSSGIFNFDWNENSNGELVVVNIFGETILKQEVAANSKLSLDFSSFSKGIYFYSISEEGHSFSGEILSQ